MENNEYVKVMERLKKLVDKEKDKERRVSFQTSLNPDIRKERRLIHVKHERDIKLINVRINNNQKKKKKKNQNKQYDGDMNLMYKEINNIIYKKQWARLHSELKINRILHYIKDLRDKYKLNHENTMKLKELLIIAIKKRKINKKNQVDYDEENGKILSIYNLEYNNGDFHLS